MIRRRTAAWLLPWALAACTAFPVHEGRKPAAEAGTPPRAEPLPQVLPGVQPTGPESCDACKVEDVLLFASDFRQQDPAAQTHDLRRLERALATDPSDERRLRLALASVLADEPARDPARASALLDELAASDGAASYDGIVSLLRRWLEDRESAGARQARLQALLAEESERRRTLEEQLERLTEIEKSLNERETPTIVPSNGEEPAEDPAGR